MARFVIVLYILGLCGSLLVAGPVSTSPAPLVSAKAAILMDRQTGMVLWSYNADASLPMASTTKVMTAIVILEHGQDKLDQTVTISERAWAVGGNWLLEAGESLTLRDLLRAILISSSNQGTVAAAEFLADGNVELFVQWMNEKAAQILGPNNQTHFVNPHGLYDKVNGAQHYSSARDLALITRYALTNYPLIRQTVAQGEPSQRMRINVSPRGRIAITNHNRILGKAVPGIPGARVDGVKTGFVVAAGKCLISSATLDGWQLIAVVLGGDSSYFQESLNLLHYGFSRYRWVTYASGQQPGVMVPVSRGKSRVLPVGVRGTFGAPMQRLEQGGQPVDDRIIFRGEHARAPVQSGQRIGELVLLRNGQEIAIAPAIALQSVSVSWWTTLLVWLLYAVLTVIGLYLVGRIYGTVAKNNRRRRRRLAAESRGSDSDGTYQR